MHDVLESDVGLFRDVIAVVRPGAGPVLGNDEDDEFEGARPFLHLTGVRFGSGEALVCCSLAESGKFFHRRCHLPRGSREGGFIATA